METSVCQRVSQYTPFPTHLCLQMSICNKSFVWFEASDFCYTGNTGSSLRRLSDVLLLPRVMEFLWFWICRTKSFNPFCEFINRVDTGKYQFKALDMGLRGIRGGQPDSSHATSYWGKLYFPEMA